MVGVVNNRRTQYTVNALKNALMALLEKKPLDKITVTEICHLADVNRGTFYLHYDSPVDLLDQIEGEILDEILPLLATKDHDHFADWMISLVNVVDKHRDAMRVVIQDNREESALTRLFSKAHEHMLADCETNTPGFNRKKMEYQFTYCCTGTIGLIKKWLEDDDLSAKELSNLLTELMTSSGIKATPNVSNSRLDV
ncbi:TetR/AcrR family transcriptional regulator [Secundilactobacillus folii]|uniref:TetR family transcriptional regulator n=1 Tax=Secundilactobacillus folii TaxID=2678357 RepID=A0A7X2XVA4_9LACO|nr:TetR/AcrR family transcriptional regulator [Secundilactobacillus folii]MTV82271.1 TetR family transcriptional regulator [Secundilactobacillus folii]